MLTKLDSNKLHLLRQRAATFFLGMSAASVLRMFHPRISIVILMGALLSFLFDYLKSKQVTKERVRCFMWSGVVGSGLVIWLLPVVLAGIPIESKVVLLERYGGEWQSSNEFQIKLPDRHLLQNSFTEGRYYRFTPMLQHTKPGALLTSISLFIHMPNNLKLQETKLWRITDIGAKYTTYWAMIPHVQYGILSGIDESLFIAFPKADTYVIPYTIVGTIVEGSTVRSLNPIKRIFAIKLTG